MKKFLFVLAVCVLGGCVNKAQQAQETAQGFLDAFLANDFKAAAAFCSDDFSVDFGKAIEDFEKLDSPVKEMVVEQCSKLKADISSTTRVNESDTFVVRYSIVNSKELISSGLKVVDGKIVSLNK